MLITTVVQNVHAPFAVVKLIRDIASHRAGPTNVAHTVNNFLRKFTKKVWLIEI
jgi:hypothetical protein